MTILGIDLGTTNSAAAVFQDGKARLIKNAVDEYLTPSVVGFDKEKKMIVGAGAKAMMSTEPDSIAANFKRHMGTCKQYSLSGRTFSPIELSALVLRSLKKDAERQLSQNIQDAVVSVPAYFNDNQRKATFQAATLAGLNVRRLINEPTAAALAYSLHEEMDDIFIFVFDLGGGTFDVSIIEKFDDVMEIHASAGNTFLGGEDFTDIVFEYFKKAAEEKGRDLSNKDLARLRVFSDNYKHQIGSDQSARFSVNGAYHDFRLQGYEFEQLAKSLIDKLKKPCERALRDSGLNITQFEHVVLVGGATRMPFIRQVVASMFQQLPKSHLDPDLVVAQGAAIQAALISKEKSLKEKVMTDVTPYTLGIETSEQIDKGDYDPGIFLPILERNNTVPLSREKSVYPISPRTKQLELKIYQGESRYVKNNIYIGKLDVDIEKKPADKEEVRVRLTFDSSGMLEAQATVVSTDKVFKAVLGTNDASLPKEQIEAIFKKLEAIKMHPREQIENKTILARAEALFEELLGDERLEVSHAIMTFKAALESQNSKRIESAKQNMEYMLDHYHHFIE